MERKRDVLPQLLQTPLEKHFLCRYALGIEADISLYLSEAIRQSESAIRAHSLIPVVGIIMHLRCPSEVVIQLRIYGQPFIYTVFDAKIQIKHRTQFLSMISYHIRIIIGNS